MILIGLLVVEYLVLPQLAGAGRALPLIRHVNVFALIAAAVTELLALAAYAQLTRSVLPAESRPNFSRAMRIDLSTLAVSHLVPGGAAAGGSLGYRLLTDRGVSGPDAGFALATQGLGSAVVLNAILWLGLLVSIPARGFNPIYATAAVLGLVLLGGFAALVLLLSRGEARAASAAGAIARRLPFLDEEAVDRLVHRLADRVSQLAGDRPLLLRAAGWAAANWLLDAASLWIFVAAFGHRVSIDGLIVAYGVANVLAAIPVTPGGLGVVEAVLTSSLVGFGTPKATAILGVITYRLMNFWLPIPAGALSYVSLEVGLTGSKHRRRREIRQMAEASLKEAQPAGQWAERIGIKRPNLRQHESGPPD